MKKSIIYGIVASFLLGSALSSCNSIKNANNTQKGAAIGAVSGAVLGGILGNNLGKGGKGALGAVLGGVVGGVVGGVIGNKMDRQARSISESLPGAKVERVGEGIKLTLGENSVNFDFNKATLTPKAKANLDRLIPVFKEYPDTDIKIYGYTDSKGADNYNLSLSEQRANAVRGYLVAKGLKSTRFNITGMGEADPIASNESDAGRAENRRVEFAITANEKMVQDAKKEAGQ
ncbi:OmpA family protein [Flavobacterium amniphilum]|uniref:OmpA family protein n=1 Tax=Flavobacterium amniphilum TaxID=1834035 RepID=UPI00202A93E2|nr:OmpA family protein [Flavobacterium amniphilum]MCL9806225.1 OmpA family protein [Flavobacterium amniphilum]